MAKSRTVSIRWELELSQMPMPPEGLGLLPARRSWLCCSVPSVGSGAQWPQRSWPQPVGEPETWFGGGMVLRELWG